MNSKTIAVRRPDGKVRFRPWHHEYDEKAHLRVGLLLSAVRLDVLPAVDVDFRAIHVGCAAGAEEVDQRSDLLRPAEAVQRDAALDDLLGARRQDRGVDLPGAMAFTRTPCGPKSWAISRVSADNAALEVA